jgi:acyl dehydratase
VKTYAYDSIAVGQTERFSVTVGPEQMAMFRVITGDENSLHTEHNVAYGLLTASYLSTLAGMHLPGDPALIHGVSVEFPRPLQLASPKELSVAGTVIEKNDTFKFITIKVSISDDAGRKYLRGSMKVGFRA